MGIEILIMQELHQEKVLPIMELEEDNKPLAWEYFMLLDKY
jgi:hypothetical protein